jgi:hypothetical protein
MSSLKIKILTGAIISIVKGLSLSLTEYTV